MVIIQLGVITDLAAVTHSTATLMCKKQKNTPPQKKTHKICFFQAPQTFPDLINEWLQDLWHTSAMSGTLIL